MPSDYRGLIVWQLADELQAETLKLVESPNWRQDFSLRDETRKTASQIVRNIPEGFRRGPHGEFAKFIEYSFSSLGELRALFDEAQKKGYVTAADLRPARLLCYRLERAERGLIRYLKRTPTPPWWNR